MKTNSFNEKLVRLTIRDLGSQGEGVGTLEGYTFFVEGALPGEEVIARETLRKARYGKGELVEILKESKDRIIPICPLFGTCGGCQLMHLAYAAQLKVKTERVKNALVRLGGFEEVDVKPCLPSPLPLGYRNKIQFVACGHSLLELGLYAKASHDPVFVEDCFLHSEKGQEVYHTVRFLLREARLTAKELRHLLIKTALYEEKHLVVFVGRGAPTKPFFKVAKELCLRLPHVKGALYNRNDREDNVILGDAYTLLAGESFIEERLLDLTFKVSAASFFQINPLQAERLYAKALEAACLKGDERILDAYCGVGTLSLVFARHVKEVIGVEVVPEAICDAKENAKRNGVENVIFLCSKVEKYMLEQKAFDLVIVNPPRKGCDFAFLESLIKLRPLGILYVSCDPATLARDLKILVQAGYRIESIQPFDMFPQTSHVETLVKLIPFEIEKTTL